MGCAPLEQVGDGTKTLKARLVARGFEEDMLDVRTDSPTCSRQSLRLCIATAKTIKCDLHSLDIKSAFLQGNQIERDAFLNPPKEYRENGMVWKLKKCIWTRSKIRTTKLRFQKTHFF